MYRKNQYEFLGLRLALVPVGLPDENPAPDRAESIPTNP
jgi:hypothetical protein